MAKKPRLDSLLHTRGFFDSREKARRAIMAGLVRIGDRVADKPGQPTDPDAAVSVRELCRYVSRGGLKLEAALTAFGIDPTGKICLDIGASTGGFTDCLLQHGAAKVYAYDVGHDQLDWRIRSHPQVIVREKINVRYLTPEDISEKPELIVIDVSFISLTLILPAAFGVLASGGKIVTLIKPQFELTREQVGKGGVVADAVLRESAIEKIRTFIHSQPEKIWGGVIPSPITGTTGNQEYLALINT